MRRVEEEKNQKLVELGNSAVEFISVAASFLGWKSMCMELFPLLKLFPNGKFIPGKMLMAGNRVEFSY